jgi:murein DD-endopeptidase MepM/ murein hydrolase activator NlpD
MEATSPAGLGATYIRLFGNPFDRPPEALVVIPGDLQQPELLLPFAQNQTWAFTGGPHPVWGDYTPWAALDFAPAGVNGCASTDKWVMAAAAGVVTRSEANTVVLDLDGDGHEQTGWVLFHFHMSDFERIAAGTQVAAGDPLGHPSCEGGTATGTHVHIARKYNGEWLPADGLLPGVVPFVLGGWTAQRGAAPYLGRMMRLGAWVEACTCSTAQNTVYWAAD